MLTSLVKILTGKLCLQWRGADTEVNKLNTQKRCLDCQGFPRLLDPQALTSPVPDNTPHLVSQPGQEALPTRWLLASLGSSNVL